MKIWIVNFLITLALAPLMTGFVNKTKAFFAGRRGASVFQLYFDLAKLLRKSSPRSTTSTWIFAVAPLVSLATLLAACTLFPWGFAASPNLFAADAVVFFYLMGTGRFFTVLGALDTGSAFEGMGASREVQFSALVEVIVFALLGFLLLLGDCTSLSAMLTGFGPASWIERAAPMALAAVAFFVVMLSENCRVPFDDPETHLELTMIHEAMILDNSGPDLACILYGASLKLWALAAFLVLMIIPNFEMSPWLAAPVFAGSVLLMGVVVGIVESCIARMRFLKTPQVLLGAIAISVLSLILLILFK